MGVLIHGDAKRGGLTRLYRIYHNMIERCYNPNKPDYCWYGGKGVAVCEEWKGNYVAFREWAMKNGYRDDLTLDREDGDKNYCPENCRWVSMIVQNNNKKNLPTYEYNGESHTMSEWARILGVSRGLLKDRILKLGWSVEKAFTTPARKIDEKFYQNGEWHTWKEWSEITGININVLHSRYYDMKWSVEKTLTEPVKHKNKQH